MSVFKAYDIRGIYPDEIDEKLGFKIGAALVHLLSAKRLVVGRDMRASAPSVQRAIMDGITSQGCDVIDIGLVSTPMAYFGIGSLDCDGGLSTTASHNPPEYIGAKICREDAKPMSAANGLLDIERMCREQEFPPADRPGTIESVDIRAAYREHIQRHTRPWPGRKVVIDTANGMGGLEVPLVLEGTGLDWTGLFLDLDGTFPNHEANPLKDENVADLARAVVEQGADVGFAFDGDADRCCILDEKGQRVGSDLVAALLCREFLEREPGASVVYDLRSSKILPEEIERRGGRPIRERVGHSFIKATMRDNHTPFAGELSGHFYYRDHYYSDCATRAMIGMLNLMAQEDRPLSELVAPLKKYYSTGEVNFEVDDPDAKIEELKQRFAGAEVDELDGITVTLDDFWFNVRKSNTEPLLRLQLEADTAEILELRNAELIDLLGTPE
jgi:phosphomannomutase